MFKLKLLRFSIAHDQTETIIPTDN